MGGWCRGGERRGEESEALAPPTNTREPMVRSEYP